ncbi:MAG: ClbS/DfsB family four-helix bundle protein [Acidimicrobiales bacterium]
MLPDLFGLFVAQEMRLRAAKGPEVTDVNTGRSVVEDIGPWRRSLRWRRMHDVARPTTKAELAAAADTEFDRLWAAVDRVPLGERERGGACEAWSVKDLLAHLHAWQEMTLSWERAGSAGERPPIPAEGHTFADTPALNEAIYQRTKNDAWDDVVARLQATHAELMAVVQGYSDDDLFTKQRFAWTRSTSVGAYLVSATSSHYAWASKLIRKWATTRPP